MLGFWETLTLVALSTTGTGLLLAGVVHATLAAERRLGDRRRGSAATRAARHLDGQEPASVAEDETYRPVAT